MRRIIECDGSCDHSVIVRPAYYESAGYNGRSSGGVAALAAVAVLLILLVWGVLPSQTASSRMAAVPMEPPMGRNLTDTRYVTADALNLREGPGDMFVVSYILPRGTEVTLFGEEHRDLNGNVWLRVSVETLEGRQSGWVHGRYVS
jgi:uncharacterized protein YgiM (DUF1202 family)